MLGRKGALAAISKEMGKLTPEERSRVGKLLNGAKQALEGALEARKAEFDRAALQARLDAEWVDLTLPAVGPRRGSLHPITIIQSEIEELFVSMGFTVLDGPEVETEQNNFDALNIPGDHPARDMQDTFWLKSGHLLRTHTSPVQVRGMRKLGPPLRMIAPGRVFRNEEVDARPRAHVLSARGDDDRPRGVGRQPDLLHEDAAELDLQTGCDGAAAAGLLPVCGARGSSWISNA